MTAPQFTYKIIFQQKNITRDISDHLRTLSYTDKVSGESDELTLELHDKDALWQNEWYPLKKSTFSVQIIDNGYVLDCGTFVVDENKFNSSRDGDVFTISALAASVGKKLRTIGHSAHENKTLGEIARTIAAKHGLKVEGTIEPITLGRVTQHKETDLGFLRRLATDYGYAFSVRGDKLIFTGSMELEQRAPSLSIDRTGVSSFDFTDKSQGTAKKAKVKHHNSETNTVVSADVDAEDVDPGADTDSDPAEDDMVINERVENDQQAKTKAKAKLHKQNSEQELATIAMQGNYLLVSGNNIELTGFGRFSGKYHILESSHTLARDGGWTTSFTAKKVKKIDKKKHYPKKGGGDDEFDLKESLRRSQTNFEGV